jgi:uncharacterized protein YndB with AHSA1/START domain
VADDEPIVREIYIEASPEETFPYLTDSDKYLRWMGVSAELDPRPGGLFKVDPNGRDVISGKFIAIEPPRRIVFTWGWAEAGRPVPAGSTTVEIELIPQGTGTLLRLVHRGLSGIDRDKHATGWPHYLARLKTAAAGGEPGLDPFAVPTHRHG